MSEQPSNETIQAWPNCRTPDCENKASARRNSLYCDPCTNSMQADNSAPKGYFDAFREAQRRTER